MRAVLLSVAALLSNWCDALYAGSCGSCGRTQSRSASRLLLESNSPRVRDDEQGTGRNSGWLEGVGAPDVRIAAAQMLQLVGVGRSAETRAHKTDEGREMRVEALGVHGEEDTDSARRSVDPLIFTLNNMLVDVIKGAIDLIYAERDYARFYVLETIARVPYFAYLSVMHLRETFGAREPGMRERMHTHYLEADNELHHLLIMEELGGNSSAADRSLAQGLAFFYYWYVVVVYSISEQAAYHLSELIEQHAYATYDDLLQRKGNELKQLPVPAVAAEYYGAGSSGLPTSSRQGQELASLYDVFVHIRNDEGEHWSTLCSLVQHDQLPSERWEASASKPMAEHPECRDQADV